MSIVGKISGTSYDAEYYTCHCGVPYVRDDHWLGFFGRIADHIVEELHPSTVLDAGCAKGFLVEALRDRGVEAYGIDISEYAISQVREDIRPFCRAASLTETLDRDYDLIVTIEVLEHLASTDGILAIRNLCQHTNRILFSSTPDDKEEPTHLCVQPPDYWASLFAKNGYWHKLEYNATFISPQAVYFVKEDKHIATVVAEYEQTLYKRTLVGNQEEELRKAREATKKIQHGFEQVIQEQNKMSVELARLNLFMETKEQEIIRLGTEIIRKKNKVLTTKTRLMEIDEENYYLKKSIAALNSELLVEQDLREQMVEANMRLAQQDSMLNSMLNSQSWRLTSSLRAIGRLIKPLLRATAGMFDVIRRRRFVPRLEPAHQIEILPNGAEYRFQSTGNDPQFHLHGKYPRGWVKIAWEGAAERPMRPLLYVDRGQGLNIHDTINLGLMMGKGLQKYEAMAHLGDMVLFLRLDPGEAPGQITMNNFSMIRVSRAEVFLQAVHKHWQHQGISVKHVPAYIKRAMGIIRQDGIRGLWCKAKNQIVPGNATASSLEYEQWLQFHTLSDLDIEWMKRHSKELAYKPIFSLIVPVYNVDECWLRKCLDSVLAQVYPYWELCVADDASTKAHVRRVLEEYSAKDERIKVIFREKNGHISAASNSALEIATGEFVALLDNDDELTVDALYENALLINEHLQADMIYSDEDKMSEDGRLHSPFFKPDWSPDTFLSQMYTCHLGVYRRTLIEEIGGFRVGFEGSQDYDLVLRLTERIKEIFHIPKVLYHWRTIAGSTAAIADSKGYASLAGEHAICEALERRGECGRVESIPNYPGHFRVHYPPKGNPLISIIIPTRDLAPVLSVCLNSIFDKSTYENFEVIIVDNGSKDQETFALFGHWQKAEPERFRVLKLDIPFNYSKLNNEAARTAKGELLLLLNNDVEVIAPNWLEEMAGQALRQSIGAVGAMLYYPDDTIQHAGVVLGVGGVANHSHLRFNRSSAGYFGRLLLPANYSAVTGACLMIQKIKYWLVGGLEERLSVAFNDVDFCLKLVEKGFYNVVLPQAQLYHHESKSRGTENTPDKQERFLREIKFMQERWGDVLKKDPFYNPNLTLDREDFSLGVPTTKILK